MIFNCRPCLLVAVLHFIFALTAFKLEIPLVGEIEDEEQFYFQNWHPYIFSKFYLKIKQLLLPFIAFFSFIIGNRSQIPALARSLSDLFISHFTAGDIWHPFSSLQQHFLPLFNVLTNHFYDALPAPICHSITKIKPEVLGSTLLLDAKFYFGLLLLHTQFLNINVLNQVSYHLMIFMVHPMILWFRNLDREINLFFVVLNWSLIRVQL